MACGRTEQTYPHVGVPVKENSAGAEGGMGRKQGMGGDRGGFGEGRGGEELGTARAGSF